MGIILLSTFLLSVTVLVPFLPSVIRLNAILFFNQKSVLSTIFITNTWKCGAVSVDQVPLVQ
jgi:hypothetical protein